MDRAYSVLTVKSVEDDERVIRGVATTPAVDRVGDVIEPLGVQFKNPMPLLHQHDHDKPVGTVTFNRPTKSGVTFEARLPKIDEPGPLRDRIETAWGEVKAGLVRGVSIGFRALDGGYEVMSNGALRFLKTEVLELSLVSIPANAEATITAIKKFDTGARAASGPEPSVNKPAALGDPKHVTRKGIKMARKTYAERIAAFEDTLSAKRAEMAEIMDSAEEDARTLDAEEKDAYDDLEREVGEIRDHLKRLKGLQADAAAKAQPVEAEKDVRDPRDVSAPVPAKAKAPKPEPGIRLARYARCLGLAKNQHRDVLAIAQEQYGARDPAVVDMVKAAVIASNTTTDAALIGNEGGWADFVEFLRPRTIIGRFGMDGIPAMTQVPFRVPLITEASESTAYWVGEGKAKPLTKASFSRTEINPLKVATIAVATMEQLRDSSPAAEALIRNSLANAIVKRQDQSFIDPTNSGSAGVSPASIINGISAAAVTEGQDADAVRDDVRAIMGAFVSANNPLNSGVWIMSATTALSLSLMQNALGQQEFTGITMRGGTFFGLPVITSQYVGDYVSLVNAEDIYLADDGGVTIDMSMEASLEMMDNPTGDSIASTPVAAELVSLWQTNSVGFRAERTVNWMRRRASAVAWIDNVAWGQGAS